MFWWENKTKIPIWEWFLIMWNINMQANAYWDICFLMISSEPVVEKCKITVSFFQETQTHLSRKLQQKSSLALPLITLLSLSYFNWVIYPICIFFHRAYGSSSWVPQREDGLNPAVPWCCLMDVLWLQPSD